MECDPSTLRTSVSPLKSLQFKWLGLIWKPQIYLIMGFKNKQSAILQITGGGSLHFTENSNQQQLVCDSKIEISHKRYKKWGEHMFFSKNQLYHLDFNFHWELEQQTKQTKACIVGVIVLHFSLHSFLT